MSSDFSKIPYHEFLKFIGTILVFSVLQVHCTWTPQVKTLIYEDDEGHVALETSSNFIKSPQHPQKLSSSLIKKLLGGISQKQEKGILQELLLSDQKISATFSSQQIEFLTPHLVEAFSKATSEELITFYYTGKKDGTIQISGTLAVFPPAVFFLTLQTTRNYPVNLSKMNTSSQNLQNTITLAYLQEKAVLQPEEAKHFMKVPSKESWIAINLGVFDLEVENLRLKEKTSEWPTNSHSDEIPTDLNSLREQVEDLRKQVDEQEKEIQRLRQTPTQ